MKRLSYILLVLIFIVLGCNRGINDDIYPTLTKSPQSKSPTSSVTIETFLTATKTPITDTTATDVTQSIVLGGGRGFYVKNKADNGSLYFLSIDGSDFHPIFPEIDNFNFIKVSPNQEKLLIFILNG